MTVLKIFMLRMISNLQLTEGIERCRFANGSFIKAHLDFWGNISQEFEIKRIVNWTKWYKN